MITDLRKASYEYRGENGLPEHYPCPKMGPDGLFYIQKNQNENTVIYEVNRLLNGLIDEEQPLSVYWIRYTDGGGRQELNLIQKQLAYGYQHQKINTQLYEVNLVSYTKRKLYIDDNSPQGTVASLLINGKMSYLSNAYVYAQELGLFPQVKYIELFGFDIVNLAPVYEKIVV